MQNAHGVSFAWPCSFVVPASAGFHAAVSPGGGTTSELCTSPDRWHSGVGACKMWLLDARAVPRCGARGVGSLGSAIQ